MLQAAHSCLQMPILCELASFVAPRHPDGLAAARALAVKAAGWVETHEASLALLEAQSSAKNYSTKRAQLQRDCALASMLVVHAYRFVGDRQFDESALERADVARLLAHLVLAHFYHRCAPDADGGSAWSTCLWVMANAQTQISRWISLDASIVSDAARALFATLPDGLTWTVDAGSHGCYIAEHAPCGGNQVPAFYSVNLLTGAALRNGAAPARLPSASVQHPVYQKTFGGLEFDVTDDCATRQRIQGRVYRVLPDKRNEKQLVVTETEGSGDDAEVLELLPGALRHVELCLLRTFCDNSEWQSDSAFCGLVQYVSMNCRDRHKTNACLCPDVTPVCASCIYAYMCVMLCRLVRVVREPAAAPQGDAQPLALSQARRCSLPRPPLHRSHRAIHPAARRRRRRWPR